jgi:predicted nucleic acid-binding protein
VLALDTDVLVSWAMTGAPRHHGARRLVEREIREPGGRLALAPQVLFEFVHVCTDPRRFESPLSVAGATAFARDLWDSREVVRVTPGPGVLHRTLELLTKLRLGRKRILDTALAATLEAAGIRRLATLNRPDFEVFPFIEVVSPD